VHRNPIKTIPLFVKLTNEYFRKPTWLLLEILPGSKSFFHFVLKGSYSIEIGVSPIAATLGCCPELQGHGRVAGMFAVSDRFDKSRQETPC